MGAAGQQLLQSMQTTKNFRTSTDAQQETPEPRPRIALLTPYTGGNLGDSAIQDSMIANLRRRLPEAEFTGITLSSENFLRRHGVAAFPLLAASPSPAGSPMAIAGEQQTPATTPGPPVSKHWTKSLKRVLRSVPGFVPTLKRVRARFATVHREISHALEGYRFLRTHDLLLVSGGGQLDDEWGGPWELPYALCKWVLLAHLARVPCAMASVGAGKITSRASRMLFFTALCACRYRSYRETKTHVIAAGLLQRAASDPVVADLAFSLPDSGLPSSAGIREMARGRTIIALSPIAYAKPENWPTPDQALHDRYVDQLVRLLSGLSQQGYFLVVACSSLGDDESVVAEILERLDDETKRRLDGRIYFPEIETWRDLVAVLHQVDYLIASRLHGTILGFVTQTPVIAISFDPKVDWVMEDFRQTDYLLHIQDFTADQVLTTLDRLKPQTHAVVERIASYRQEILPALAHQYDSLAVLVLEHHQSRI
jgi:polysaccharide pyruvyl transferase WcaK-like protein